MLPTAVITAGTAGVGQLTVNPADVRADGAPTDPALVVPLDVQLNARPETEQVALRRLDAALGLGFAPNPERLCPPVHAHLGLDVISIPNSSPTRRVELRFRLTADAVERIERHRHEQDGRAWLSLKLSGEMAWVHAFNQVQPGAAGGSRVPFEPRYGMLAHTTEFWTTQISDLSFIVEQSVWVEAVLPALGYDQRRLIEVRLPTELDDDRARTAFARQLRHLDKGGYAESVAASRAVLRAWELRLGATAKRPVAEVVADHRGWAATDPRRQLLEQLWVAAKGLANASHHEAEQDVEVNFDAASARAHLLVTAALSEWLSDAVATKK